LGEAIGRLRYSETDIHRRSKPSLPLLSTAGLSPRSVHCTLYRGCPPQASLHRMIYD